MKRRVKLGDVEFSVVEDEKPRDTVTITDNAVENGQDVSDHVKQESSIIDIVGVMVGDDAATKLATLKRYQREGKLLNYVGRNAYNNMAIQTIDRNHGKKISNGFAYNINLKQVRIATAKEVEIQVADPVTKKASPKTNTKVKAKTNNGKQQPKGKDIALSEYGAGFGTASIQGAITEGVNKSNMYGDTFSPTANMKFLVDLYKPKTEVAKRGEVIS